jgi:D-threo-aldose 1-dehydrogenase
MDAADFDCFLLAGRYTLLDQSALPLLLPRCAERGISILAGGVFNSGILVNGSAHASQSHYDYAVPSAEIIEHVRRIEAICAKFNVALPAAAIQFTGAHPQIASVIVGCANAREVDQLVEWSSQPLSADFWDALVSAGLLPESAPTPRGTVA